MRMNNDEKSLAEAYQRITESTGKCSSSLEGCDCNDCEDCTANQKVEESTVTDSSSEMTEKVLAAMENLKTKNPEAFKDLLAQLVKIADHNEDSAQGEHEHKGWPGDGSGEDDFADYNQNEGNDY